MTLKEQKQQNYQVLLKVLGELEQLVVCRFDVSNANTVMKNSIIGDYELQTTLEHCSKSHPELVQATDTGYAITMIAPEAKNESDPVKDTLSLNKVEDIFWARDIVARAFLGLFPNED